MQSRQLVGSKVLRINEIPIIRRQNNSKYYWYIYLENKKTIYLQINQINDTANDPTLMKFQKMKPY